MVSLPVMMSPKERFWSTCHQLWTSSSARGGASKAPPSSTLEFFSLHLVRMLCCVCVWAPLTSLLPSEIRRGHHSPWTEVVGGYKPLCGCWELALCKRKRFLKQLRHLYISPLARILDWLDPLQAIPEAGSSCMPQACYTHKKHFTSLSSMLLFLHSFYPSFMPPDLGIGVT